MPNKATIASDWLAGCAGCHMSLLDIDERLVTLLEHASFHATPITDLKHPPVSGVDVGILEGCVNNSATERVGCCAALRRAYIETESTAEGRVPSDPELAVMQEARPLDQVVKVDIYLPGCPPPPDAIFHALAELSVGRKPMLIGKNLDWH
jgi:NAD-reducing hydrogenase small subunit